MNDTNSTDTCYFIDSYSKNILSFLDLVNRASLSYILLLTFTIANIRTIFKSRKRISTNKRLAKDIKFAITSIILNLIFIFFTLPVTIIVFFPVNINNDYFICLSFLFFIAYGVNFYTMTLFNSAFRAFRKLKIQFKNLFYRKKKA